MPRRTPAEPPANAPLTQRNTVDATRTPLEPLGCSVRVLQGEPEDVGRTFNVPRGTATVGCAEGCEILLRDRRVSRQHLEIRIELQGVGLRDLGSTNGTFVLGARVQEAVVVHGTQVTVGSTVLLLAPLADGDAALPLLTHYGSLVGESIAMRRLFGLLERLERTEAPVLINAETGTGKELVAQALHENSVRVDKPFVVFDCGAVSRELIESELFGYVRGAFTGAQADRPGVFERADGGTLFLDEIGELPLEMQTRLLRALERGEVKRVGDGTYRKVDVRVVAATHRDLAAAAKRGEFREDLFYRVAVVCVTVPPLRERLDDIAPLAKHFARLFGAEDAMTPEVLAHLTSHGWPGNARELRNAVQRVVALGAADGLKSLASSLSSPAPSTALPYKEAKERLVDEFEGKYIRDLLARNRGNVSAAARDAQLSRRHFHELLRKHGLRVGE